MYAHIKGIVDSIQPDRAIIEANGVGYELICSRNTLGSLTVSKPAKLYTHFHFTQDSVSLFGFYTDGERSMFRKLIGISKVGPKVALSILSTMTVDDIVLAVLTDNEAAFSRVQGVGKKSAQRLILELKEKVDDIPVENVGLTGDSVKASSSMRSDVIAALTSMGCDGISAGRIVASLPDCETVEEMLKLGLKELSKNV